jgi:hypothetical protein
MPRYLEIEIQEEKQKKAQQKALDQYALERKYNKAKPNQLFEYIITETTHKPYNYLYNSNNKSSWYEIDNLLTYSKLTYNQKNNIINILRVILKKSETFIELYDNVVALKAIVDLYKDRIRDIEDWKPKKRNPHTLLSDLLNHLFAKYPVPEFLVKGFTKYDINSILLYTHIGAGMAIKKFELMPNLVLNNKCYHHLQTTPDFCTFNEAFRRAQIISMGGNNNLFVTLMNTKLNIITNNKITIEQDQFWITVIKFFIDNTMIEPDKIHEIIDYIYDQKFVNKRIQQPDGSYKNEPQQPNFTIKGRTPMSLINQSDEWHRLASINAKRAQNQTEWEPVEINDFHLTKHDSKYDIIQLTKTKELIQEGNAMHNCVATYASACIKGYCSIFSLRYTNFNEAHFKSSYVTIEVRNKQIVQIRARYNKKPDQYHLNLIKSWADQNKLSISNYA